MDFDIKKPLHILALLMVIFAIVNILVLPIISFFNIIPFLENVENLEMLVEKNIFFDIFNFLFTLIFVFFTFIIIPIVWYLLVNNLAFKKALHKMRLKLENIDVAFLWGILSAILIFIVFTAIEFLLIALGYNLEDQSNIDVLDKLYSPIMLFFLVTVQPIGEEVFFRGFLLEKLEGFAGKNLAIICSAILFGVAHMSYGMLYPVVFAVIIGFVLAYIVIKTNNLYSAIIAHIVINSASYVLYILAKSIT